MKNIMRTVPGKIIIYVLTCVMMLTAIVSAGELAACFEAGLYERTPEDIIQAEVAEDTFNAAHIIIADVINQQIVSGKDIDESENNDLYMSTIYDPGNLAFCVTDEKGKVLRQSDGFDRSKAKYTYYLKANESKESKAETANEDVEIEVYSNDIKEPETMNADTGNGAALNDSEEPELETTNEDTGNGAALNDSEEPELETTNEDTGNGAALNDSEELELETTNEDDENGTTLNDNEEPKWDATNLSGTKDDPDASYMTVKIYYEGNDGIPDNTRNGLKKKIYDNMYKYRNDAIPAGIISAVLSLVFFIMMLCVSARRPNSHELYPGYFNKVPYDVMLVAAVGAFGIFAAIIDTIGPDEIQIIAIGIAIIYLVIAFNALCMSAAARIKQGTLLKNTLIFIVCRWCFNLAKIIVKKYVAGVFKWFFALVSGMFSSIKEIFNKFPLIWKSAVIFGVIALVDLIIFAICWDWSTPELYLVYWFITRIVLFVIMCRFVLGLRGLQAGGRALAAGDFEHKIDTDKLHMDFKEHGENLNHISEGMINAVEEKMKSERMKTELITNVSHDIKTPLTSIINYADLIGKEDTDNEKIKEYTEVLLRQSERLKRLIEDLVEASKASTGNLEVELAPCEASMFITQIAGEYEEKFNKAGFTLVTKGLDNSAYIMADGRRMLRVFDNLMNNICKYALENSRVYLTLEVKGVTGANASESGADTGTIANTVTNIGTSGANNSRQVLITFKNTSKTELDMPPEELMERFVRGDQSRNTEGNGLGLSIARSLTELQNGTFDIFIDGDLFKVVLSFPVKE